MRSRHSGGLAFVSLLAVALLSGCGTSAESHQSNNGFVGEALGVPLLEFLDEGINANTDEWKAARVRVEERLSEPMPESELIIMLNAAALVAGGEHSGASSHKLALDTFMAPGEGNADMPVVEVVGNVVVARLPHTQIRRDDQNRYARILQEGIAAADPCGTIVDLRGNTGGAMARCSLVCPRCSLTGYYCRM